MHVKIKESEITIEFSMSYLAISVPRTGLEPARLSTLALTKELSLICVMYSSSTLFRENEMKISPIKKIIGNMVVRKLVFVLQNHGLELQVSSPEKGA